MSGPRKIVSDGLWICQRKHGLCTIACRNARRSAIQIIDADGKRSSMPCGVNIHHHRQIKLRRARFGERRANNSARAAEHERDHLRRNHFCRRDKIAFVLAIFIIDNDHHPSAPDVFKSFVDGVEHIYSAALSAFFGITVPSAVFSMRILVLSETWSSTVVSSTCAMVP
jgi:hypothetical protein